MPVGSWLQQGGVTGRAAGGPSPVLTQMQKQQPLEGWGTMGQVPGAIAGLVKPPALDRGPIGVNTGVMGPAPSIATKMASAAAPAKMSTAQKMAEWRARDAAMTPPAAVPVTPPAVGAMPEGGFEAARPMPNSGGFMGKLGGIASRLREMRAPGPALGAMTPAPSIAGSLARGGFAGRRPGRRGGYE